MCSIAIDAQPQHSYIASPGVRHIEPHCTDWRLRQDSKGGDLKHRLIKARHFISPSISGLDSWRSAPSFDCLKSLI
jgi:hypothetical protein